MVKKFNPQHIITQLLLEPLLYVETALIVLVKVDEVHAPTMEVLPNG